MAGPLSLSVQHTCLPNGAGAELRVTVRSNTPQVSCYINGPEGQVYEDSHAASSYTFRFSPVPDGLYQVLGSDSAGGEDSRSYTVSCGTAPAPTTPPAPCDLAITELLLTPATEQLPFPQLTCLVSTTAATISADLVDSQNRSAGSYAAGTEPGPLSFPNLLPGAYALQVTDSAGCRATEPITVPGPPEPDPDAPTVPAPAPRFVAVGGLLARPALLNTPVSRLFDALGQPRRGLHVELELSREGSPAPFARLRQTVRAAGGQQVDAAAALAPLLQPGYPRSSLPVFGDNDVSAAFTYRFREVDAEAAGNWQQDAGRYVAVLAGLPPLVEEDDYLSGYLSFSAFPSGQLVQQVGYGLELTAWLPGVRTGDWFAEFRYLDQAGGEVSIVTLPIPAYVPAGVLRVALPARPPVCAASVEFRLTDSDRGYVGSCPDGQPTTTPPPAGGPHDFNISDFSDPDFL